MTSAALNDFLAIGGRIMLAPDRKLTSTIDMAALFSRGLPDGEATRRRHVVKAFATYERRDTARLRRMVARKGMPVNGFTVLEGTTRG